MIAKVLRPGASRVMLSPTKKLVVIIQSMDDRFDRFTVGCPKGQPLDSSRKPVLGSRSF